MDQTQRQLQKHGSDPVNERSQAGGLLFGGIVLVLGGVVLLLQAHASVAHFGGGMLILIGLALVAAAIWLYAQDDSDG